MAHTEVCRRRALLEFSHRGKINAIIAFAEHVSDTSFDRVRDGIAADPTGYLLQLPYFGPATSCHLAKNIGVAVVKPDRHLSRMAARCRHGSPAELCQAISERTGDPIGLVDLVLWRYAALMAGNVATFVQLLHAATEDYLGWCDGARAGIGPFRQVPGY